MKSANSDVQAMHDAYNKAMGMSLSNNPAFERYWLCAIKAGLTAEDVGHVIAYRVRQIKEGNRRPACVFLRNLVGSDEAIGDTLNEAAVLRSHLKRQAFEQSPQAKALSATGRPPSPVQSGLPKLAGEVARVSFAAMREAAGMPPVDPSMAPVQPDQATSNLTYSASEDPPHQTDSPTP